MWTHLCSPGVFLLGVFFFSFSKGLTLQLAGARSQHGAKHRKVIQHFSSVVLKLYCHVASCPRMPGSFWLIPRMQGCKAFWEVIQPMKWVLSSRYPEATKHSGGQSGLQFENSCCIPSTLLLGSNPILLSSTHVAMPMEYVLYPAMQGSHG